MGEWFGEVTQFVTSLPRRTPEEKIDFFAFNPPWRGRGAGQRIVRRLPNGSDGLSLA